MLRQKASPEPPDSPRLRVLNHRGSPTNHGGPGTSFFFVFVFWYFVFLCSVKGKSK